jgi:hypothetical protein
LSVLDLSWLLCIEFVALQWMSWIFQSLFVFHIQSYLSPWHFSKYSFEIIYW